MDLVANRYSSPFLIIDEMIQQGRFFEFVTELNTIRNEEELWDIWLHKVFDKGFEDWKASLHLPQEPSKNDSDVGATVKNSFEILSGFSPE